MKKQTYESDATTFDADAYTVDRWSGIAWRVLGWKVEPDADTEWSGYYIRTGEIVCRMIGDDRDFTFDPDDVTPLDREAYCGECGQIGCRCDGLERD